MMRRALPFLVLMLASAPAFAQDDAAGEPTEPADARGDQKDPAAEGSEAPEAETGDGAAAEGDAAGEAGTEGPAVGPGGKELRSDYPGTDEAMKARMETDAIEGVDTGGGKVKGAYGLRIRELETKVNDLKEKVFQSKSRIVLLRETVLSGNLAGSRAVVIHRSDLGPAFKLRQAIYSLDGNRVFNQADKNDSLADQTVFDVYDDAVGPGNHNLSVFLKYQGAGYGLFPYFEGYDFELRSSCQFKAEEGKIAQLRVVALVGGDWTTSKEQKPKVQCELTYADNVKASESAKKAAAKDAKE